MLKMIIKGRSPALKHVARTHRVDLDWLFERIREDPSVFGRYVHTALQIADILTKGNFTVDKWQSLCKMLHVTPRPVTASDLNKNKAKVSDTGGVATTSTPVGSRSDLTGGIDRLAGGTTFAGGIAYSLCARAITHQPLLSLSDSSVVCHCHQSVSPLSLIHI